MLAVPCHCAALNKHSFLGTMTPPLAPLVLSGLHLFFLSGGMSLRQHLHL